MKEAMLQLTTETQSTTRDYYEKLHANKLDNL